MTLTPKSDPRAISCNTALVFYSITTTLVSGSAADHPPLSMVFATSRVDPGARSYVWVDCESLKSHRKLIGMAAVL